MPISACGATSPSRHIRAPIAAPAECPTTIFGAMSSLASSAPSARAIPGSDIVRAAAGIAVKPCPGKSTASTLEVFGQQRSHAAP